MIQKNCRYRFKQWSQAALYSMLLALFTAAALSSCVYCDQPLSAQEFKDDQLCGKWLLTNAENKEKVQFNISAEGDNWYKYVNIERAPGETKDHTTDGRFYPTITGIGKYLNVEYLEPAKESGKTKDAPTRKFIYLKYELANDELSVWRLDEEKMVSEVKSKNLSGDFDANAIYREVRLHEQGAKILKYLEDPANSSVFKSIGKFKRV